MLRWGARVGGVLVGLLLTIGAIIATKYVMSKDPGRRRVTEAMSATTQLRTQLGRDAHVKVRALDDDGTDDDLELTVVYPASTPQPERRDLYAGTNIIVRRHVPHVREVKVVFGEEAVVEAASSDAGAAATPVARPGPGAPQPAGSGNPPASTAPPGKKTAAAAPPAKKGPTGTVTLVTFPDATVMRGKESLGHTPLFGVELPAGTHLLTLVGDDGSRHALSLQVKAGKNPPMKVNLADIPNSR